MTMQTTTNPGLVAAAERLIPTLHTTRIEPVCLVDAVTDESAFQGWRVREVSSLAEWRSSAYGKGESFALDFGDHQVGYVSLSVRHVGSPPDAPLKLRLAFGEMPCEIAESFAEYEGWLSSSWLQEETLFVDVLPAEIRLPRRYSFRFLRIEVVDASPKYKAAFDAVVCEAVSSADRSAVESLPPSVPDDLRRMDRVAIKTLQDCMQTVFEDGPKRDRRLWIGDLRLQAQANYVTFRNYGLVRRCLYLFAGMRLEDGAVGACVFEKPEPHVDDTRLYDYSLFFIATLRDYFKASGDRATLEELWPIAMEQVRIGLRRLDERDVVRDEESWYCFIDWHPELNKQAPAQAVLIYCLRRGLELARELGLAGDEADIAAGIERATKAALMHLRDEASGWFVSGAGRQVSWATQVWMALAEVLPAAEGAALLRKLLAEKPAVGMTTPYMHHHLVEALFMHGMAEEAVAHMRTYWGGMLEDGADTFWEIYNPDDKKLSPYGSNLINSYCHAWSCTPTYFIRTYGWEKLSNAGEAAL